MTDNADRFQRIGARFMQSTLEDVEEIDLADLHQPHTWTRAAA